MWFCIVQVVQVDIHCIRLWNDRCGFVFVQVVQVHIPGCGMIGVVSCLFRLFRYLYTVNQVVE